MLPVHVNWRVFPCLSFAEWSPGRCFRAWFLIVIDVVGEARVVVVPVGPVGVVVLSWSVVEFQVSRVILFVPECVAPLFVR